MLLNSSILVLGAGELGMSVLRALARRRDRATDLSVLVRDKTIHSQDTHKRKIRQELQALGVRLVAGDLHAQTSSDLASIFGGFQTVIGCTGFVGGPGTQMKITSAVLSAGVRRYVPWQFGVDYDAIGKGSAQDLFDEQLDVRALLRGQQKTKWLIISTGMFTSFLFELSFGAVDLDQGLVHALGSWDNAVTVTTAEDIGELTAAILHAEPALANEVLYTAGDTITYEQLAATVQAALGRKVHRSVWTVTYLRNELAQEPEDALSKYRVVFAEGKGVAWAKEKTFNEAKGIPVIKVQQWLRQLQQSHKSA